MEKVFVVLSNTINEGNGESSAKVAVYYKVLEQLLGVQVGSEKAALSEGSPAR